MKTQGINQLQEVKTITKATNQNANNFKTPELKNDEVNLSTTKKEVPTSKKLGVGIASAICPGLGQVCNGELGKGAKFLLGGIGIDVAATVAATALMSANPGLGLITACAGTLGHLALNVCSIVDAVKNAK